MKIKFAIGVLAVMLLAGIFARTVLADYPGTSGSVAFELTKTTAEPGEDVTVTLTVLDEGGNAVANAACTLSITDQPGTGASVTQHSAETDVNGVITGTLTVGDSFGNVVVGAACPVGPGASDDLSASGTVVVAGAVGPALPPASLPSTGLGLAAGDGGTWYAQLAIALAAAGGVLLALGLTRRAATLERPTPPA